VFFDLAGWKWSYEPIDLDGWIPDFVLHLHEPVLVEVKPALSEADLRTHCAKIDAAKPGHEVLLLGAQVGIVEDKPFGSISIGLLAEVVTQTNISPAEAKTTTAPWWEAATSFICGVCRKPSFAHSYMSYTCRVCGKGSVHRNGYAENWPDAEMRSAQNEVQWRPS
jgi:hypothetical protein